MNCRLKVAERRRDRLENGIGKMVGRYRLEGAGAALDRIMRLGKWNQFLEGARNESEFGSAAAVSELQI